MAKHKTPQTILSKYLLVDISLPHIIAVVAYESGALNPFHFRKGVYEIGIIHFKPHLHIKFDSAFGNRFAFDNAFFAGLFKKLSCRLFALLILYLKHHNEGVKMRLPINEKYQHKADEKASHKGKGNQSRRKHDAHRYRPEKKGDVKGFLYGGAETDDG